MEQKNFLITCTINNKKSEIKLIKDFSKIGAIKQAMNDLDLSQFVEDNKITVEITIKD